MDDQRLLDRPYEARQILNGHRRRSVVEKKAGQEFDAVEAQMRRRRIVIPPEKSTEIRT